MWLPGSFPAGRKAGSRGGCVELRKGRRAAPTSGGGEGAPHPGARGDRRLVPSPEHLPACPPTITVTAVTARSIRANGGT